jgi:UDP-N-acetylmuramate--alanine ligase
VTPVDHAEQLIRRGGHVHLMGIGGIGMAGIAWLLKERGLEVSGCDLQNNRQTAWLAENGIPVLIGHADSHLIESVNWLVRSTAVPDMHPELLSARQRGVPVSRRGEVLPALLRDRISIAVSGTHGKTTTTAMIAQVLKCGYCVGGEIAGVDGVAADGELMVVEADESDGTVAGYSPDFTVITNIEYDHMEHHSSEAAFIGCFQELIRNTKQKVYYRADDSVSRQLCEANPKCEPFDYPVLEYPLPLPGRHNQWNASATAAVAANWMNTEAVMRAVEAVQPVRRRFEKVFDKNGIQIISDYAHHPTEIAALIQTALELKPNRLLGIFQPHRYTRTLALGPDFPPSFSGLDRLWLVPVYAASEEPIAGGTTKDLITRFPLDGQERLRYCLSLETAWPEIQSFLQPGDVLLIIGAGDIEQLAEWAAAW